MRSQWLCAALVAASAGCHDVNEYVVAPHRVPCTGLVNTLCYDVSKDGAPSQLESDTIEGFQFEWGYESQLIVRTEHVNNPPEDASSRRLVLESVVGRTAVPGPFTLEFDETVPGLEWFVERDQPDLRIDDTTFEASPALRAAILAAADSRQPFTLDCELTETRNLLHVAAMR